ncbi:hypothetical protein L1987_77921 [Smallanthus sonchifolius]|uniref:Uncharacterized protein n=1 Tax=Smallanthus sonchifolius TaxID=185202 RepID=A0ACB8ZAY9_9ASTR|nr:hypothetical protein L1987_77921 [Smallanthus sonchifolius]
MKVGAQVRKKVWDKAKVLGENESIVKTLGNDEKSTVLPSDLLFIPFDCTPELGMGCDELGGRMDGRRRYEEHNKLHQMQASRARLFKEYKEVQREKVADPDIQLVCDDSNIFKWTALIKGPSETPYEGGVFQLAFSVPEQYPLQPPQVRFLTKIFHPNVHFKTGEICLDILKNAWSPAWTLQSVCRAIIALMAHPEPDSPLNCDSGNLLRSGDVRGFQSMAKMYTRLAAMPKKG